MIRSSLRAAGRFWRALQRRADPLRAEAFAQVIATHLLDPGQYSRHERKPTQGLSARQLRRVSDLVRARLHTTLNLDEIADAAHVSKFHLVRAFRPATGTTPHRYLIQLRMEHGAHLLWTTDLRVAEVATRCGYTSSSRFAAVYRERHGVSPQDHRSTGAVPDR